MADEYATSMDVDIELVREVNADVVEGLRRLVPQLSTRAKPVDADVVGNLLACNSNMVLLARLAGQVVGTLTLVMFPLPSGLRARIEDVVVDEAARSRGVGASLTEEAIRLARTAGARTIDLTSRPTREAANRLYQRHGFRSRNSTVFRLDLSDPPEAAASG
jgi:ribosomal protein S18 acetylase RimI-like enzyme